MSEPVEVVRSRLWREMRDDPYVRRVAARADSLTFTPLDAVGIQRVEAAWLARDDSWRVDTCTGYAGVAAGSPRALDLATQFAIHLWAAPTFAWGREILKLAWSLPLPKHIVSPDVLPHETMAWVLERSWRLREEGGPALGSSRVWFVTVAPNGIRVAMPVIPDPEDDPAHPKIPSIIYELGIPYGSRYPEDNQGAAGQVLSMLSFLNSPYVDKAPHRAVESSKKAAKRLGVDPKDAPAVRVVQLRAAIDEPRPAAGGHRDTKYSHRWIVRGHHRAQWYPSMKAHKVIWIAPYVKGPADTPIQQPVYAVVR